MEEINNTEQKTEEIPRKRGFFKRFLLFLVIIALIWWFNNYTLKTTETVYSSAKVKTPFRIAIVSDLHVHTGSISSRTILRHLEGSDPDVVFVLGDMYSRSSPQNEIDMAVKAVADIVNDGFTTYFVSGEHDTSPDYIKAVGDSGAVVMNYKQQYLDIKGNRIQLIGIDNVYYSPTFDLHNEFTVDESSFSILLAHIPNYEKFSEFGTDLTLCADSHGGFVQLPFGLGPVIDPGSTDILFPEIVGDKSVVYDKGWFKYDGGAMFITSGIGDSPAPVRFNNRPEIAVIDILPAKGGSSDEN